MELSQCDGLFAGEMWREMMDCAQGAQSQETIEAPEQTPFLLCRSALLCSPSHSLQDQEHVLLQPAEELHFAGGF